ncbi:MAG TPA: non-ribosomal peptide synthetase, partial [Longimicrobium sp.]
VASLSLRTAEAAAVLPDPSRPLVAEPWSGAVHQAFAARAAASPGALAVADPAERWTYAELDAASSRIAHRLIALGARPGDVVAVWAHRSAALARALLGVWKAGAAFVVLDPGYPAARLAKIAAAARPAAVLRLAAAGPVPAEVTTALGEAARATLTLGRKGGDDVGDAPAEAPVVEVGPDDLAYLAFTSGTTGEPKAVAGTHRPLAHFFGWYSRALAIGAGDRVSLLGGLAHDPLLRDVFAPLVAGGALMVPDPDQLATPGWLAEWMDAAGVTVAHLTPATAQMLAVDDEASLPAMRLACFGGDVLRAGDVERLRRIAPSVRAVNFYGATETPQAMAAFPVPDGVEGAVPLGRGIDGVDLLVVAPSGVLAGVGELGEIVVRTPYLSAGYRNDAELTALRFVANPWTGDAADRMYRTGDLGRHRPDGVVEAAGRADTQVKVRGFRVELAEVEAALAQHPAVRECVARLHGEGDETRLVAWLAGGGERPKPAALREHLRARLPDFMVPSAFVWLDALPLTPNGKVDRRALPDPRSPVAAVPASPGTPTEEVVAGVWAEVLGRSGVGVDDDFFRLGGRWETAIGVTARVARALEVEVPLRVLFETPTVAGMAAWVEAAGGGAIADALAELEGLSDEEVAALLAEIGEDG